MSNEFVWFHNGSDKPGDSVAFYEKLLGWKSADGPPGMTKLTHESGPFAAVMSKSGNVSGWVPYVQVDDVAAATNIESWLKERTNAYAPDERRMVKLYLEPREWLMEKPLDEVVPSDTDRLVKELRGEKKPDGSPRCVGLRGACAAPSTARQPCICRQGAAGTPRQSLAREF